MYYYIVNPAAGGGRVSRIQDEIRSALREYGIAGEWLKTLGPGDVSRLARQGLESGATTIVAVGGDGTLGEIIRSLYGESGVAIGVIPTGERNSLATLLGVRALREAVPILAARKLEQIDLGEIGGRYFVGSVGIGFEAAHPVGRGGGGSTPFRDRVRKLPAYLKASREWKASEASITLDDITYLKAPVFNLTISNSDIRSGLGMVAVDPQDRRLDLRITSRTGTSSMIRGLPGYLSGEGGAAEETSLFRASKIEVGSPTPLPVHIDGEPGGTTPVTVRVADKRVQLIVGRERQF